MIRKYFTSFFALLTVAACKTPQEGNTGSENYDPEKKYTLGLNPAAGSLYRYEITTEADIDVEVEGKTISNSSETEVTINYKIDKDSLSNFLFSMAYEKIHIKSNKNGEETEADAANGNYSLNPVDKMVAILREGKIVATVSPKGEVLKMDGYKEIGDRIMAGFAPEDVSGRKMAETQWEKSIGQELVKKNMDQLFKIFPDSAVHPGDTWNLTSRQEGELNMVVKGHYTLKAINNDLAIIESDGKISSTNSTLNAMGFSNTVATLEGQQQGQFEMETKTGMLISCKIKANLKGIIQLAGREIPVTILSVVNMKGKKM